MIGSDKSSSPLLVFRLNVSNIYISALYDILSIQCISSSIIIYGISDLFACVHKHSKSVRSELCILSMNSFLFFNRSSSYFIPRIIPRNAFALFKSSSLNGFDFRRFLKPSSNFD